MRPLPFAVSAIALACAAAPACADPYSGAAVGYDMAYDVGGSIGNGTGMILGAATGTVGAVLGGVTGIVYTPPPPPPIVVQSVPTHILYAPMPSVRHARRIKGRAIVRREVVVQPVIVYAPTPDVARSGWFFGY